MVFPVLGVAYFIINDWNVLKNHLISCEYMQIDPSVPYECLEERAELVLSEWKGDDDRSSAKILYDTLNEYLETIRTGNEMPLLVKIADITKAQSEMTGPYAFSGKAAWASAPQPPPRKKDTMSEFLSKRVARLVREGKMEILPGTVSETYVKRELRHDNFDSYMKKMPRWPN